MKKQQRFGKKPEPPPSPTARYCKACGCNRVNIGGRCNVCSAKLA